MAVAGPHCVWLNALNRSARNLNCPRSMGRHRESLCEPEIPVVNTRIGIHTHVRVAECAERRLGKAVGIEPLISVTATRNFASIADSIRHCSVIRLRCINRGNPIRSAAGEVSRTAENPVSENGSSDACVHEALPFACRHFVCEGIDESETRCQASIALPDVRVVTVDVALIAGSKVRAHDVLGKREARLDGQSMPVVVVNAKLPLRYIVHNRSAPRFR